MKRFRPILFLLFLSPVLPAFAQYGGYGLTGVYYTNPNLTSAAVTENDPWISFLWNGCPPEPNMSVSVFSAQWTGEVVPAYSEPYTFTVYVAGGVSVIVNGQAVISQWTDANHSGTQGSITLTAGTPVSLVVDYFTNGAAPVTGNEHLQLVWQSQHQAVETIPRNDLLTGSPLIPTPTPGTEAVCGATSPIAVNAALGEWEWTSPGWATVNRTVLGQTFSTTAAFKTLWDSSNLYFGVTVMDSHPVTSATQIYENSTVELFLDTTDSGSVTVGNNDFQYFFEWGSTTPVEVQNRTAGVSMRTTTIAGGYVVEASIPWSTLGIGSPSAGQVLGFDVGVDVDHNGTCRDGQLMWNGGSDDYANASSYAQLTLTSPCPTPVATPPAPVGNNPYVSPNPTSTGSVKFVYTMAEAGTANIKVWNAWGNLVATLSEPKGVGEQSSVLDVTGFAPGHYFYRIELDYGSGRSDTFKTQVLAVKK